MKIDTTSHTNFSIANGYLGKNSVDTRSLEQPHGLPSQPDPVVAASAQAAASSAASSETVTASTEENQAAVSKEKQQQTTDESRLTQAELQLVSELKQADSEVRGHEMAHIAAGGSLITSGASFTYSRGPDGQNYAVAGEVGIDTSSVPGDPQATLEKMRQVKSSALAPASPSSQDIKVASRATAMASKALSELTMLRTQEQAAANETQAFGNLKQASDSYTRVNNLPEKDTSTFSLAV